MLLFYTNNEIEIYLIIASSLECMMDTPLVCEEKRIKHHSTCSAEGTFLQDIQVILKRMPPILVVVCGSQTKEFYIDILRLLSSDLNVRSNMFI